MLEEQILTSIRIDYEGGMTQVQLAEKYHTTQSYIQRILSGQQKTSGISLGQFERMFPNAKFDLGVTHGAHAQGQQVQAITNNFGTAEQNYHEAPEPDADLIRKAADLAVSLATDDGQVPLVPFLKKLREVK